MKADLLFDGQVVTWQGHVVFKATSGLPELQFPHHQCVRDGGPIPEGLYTFRLKVDSRPASDDGTDACKLVPSRKVQKIPRGDAAVSASLIGCTGVFIACDLNLPTIPREGSAALAGPVVTFTTRRKGIAMAASKSRSHFSTCSGITQPRSGSNVAATVTT